jgi:hypothetical protein
MKVIQTDKFNLEFLNLFKGEMRVAGVGFASKNLTHEEREGARMRGHGLMQNLAGQAVAKLATRNHAFRVAAGMGTPRDKSGVLLPSGAIITKVSIWEHRDDFRIRRLVLETPLFVAIAKDVCLKFHEGKITPVVNLEINDGKRKSVFCGVPNDNN